jgi:streptogramin lyase
MIASSLRRAALLLALCHAAACSSGTVEQCTGADQCGDNVPCTVDQCTSGVCTHTPTDAMCASGELCRLDKGCEALPPCAGENDPACDDGQACTTERCNLQTGKCEYTAADTACDDGMFCNGAERCVPYNGCIPGSAVPCDDQVACTVDACDESKDECASRPSDDACDDGMFCNGAETCNPQSGCQAGPAPDCDDQAGCTVDSCDANANACVHPLRDVDEDGEADEICGGTDCNDRNRDINAAAVETCNTIDDNCDGNTDEGVRSPCGNCDQTCRQTSTGTTAMGGTVFDPDNMFGTVFSAKAGGLTVTAVSRLYNELWVPNTAESTFSRWDTATAQEMSRYRVGLPQGECPNVCCWSGPCNMPSRVVVDGRGDAYVANRGFGMQGTVTKVASRMSDCVDRNGNSVIDTSTTNRPLPYGQDECVLWNAPVGAPNSILRALTIDVGDDRHPEGYPWAGGYNSRRMYKLNPDTGEVMLEVALPIAAYGAVVMSTGRMFVSSLDTVAMTMIDTTTTTPVASPAIPYPTNLRGGCGSAYGITADQRGRIWFSGWNCRDVLGYDTNTGQWTRIDLTVYGRDVGRGITVDSSGRIWVAIGGDGASWIGSFDSNVFAAGRSITPPITIIPMPPGHTGPSGIGADSQGNIWLGHYLSSQLVRLNPRTNQIDSFTGPRQVYTYSDFTGAVRRAVIGRGFYREDYDAGCQAPLWEELAFDATVPQGSSVTFSIRTSSTATTTAALESVPSVVAARLPVDRSPVNLSNVISQSGITPGRFMRVVVQLEAPSLAAPPIVRSYSLRWHCP